MPEVVAIAPLIAAGVGAVGTGFSVYEALSNKGGGGGVPQQPGDAPAVPTLQDPSVAAAAQAQQTATAQAAGRASTILTSGQGDQSQLTTNKKTLLGG